MQFLKNFFKYILVCICLIIIYVGTMVLTSLIPQSALKKNVTKTSEVYNKEGEKKKIKILGKEDTLFIFTDALMVNTAYSVNSKKPLESALLDRKDWVEGQTTDYEADSQYNLGAFGKYKDENENVFQAAELYGLMHGEPITTSYEYARYWHGYLIFLRPLLLIFSIKGIRILQLVILCISLTLLFIFCSKRVNILTALCFIMSYFLVNIFVVSESISEFTDLFLSILACIYLLKKKDINKHREIDFLIIGSLSNFLTLLIYPIITLGIPLAMYFAIIFKENKLSIKEIILNFIELTFSWCIGYGVTWFTKWVLVEAIYNRPIIKEAIMQIKYRGINKKITYVRTIIKNMNEIGNIPFIVFAIMILVITIIKYRNTNLNKNCSIKCIPFILIALLPFLWIFVIRQHSYIHSFFVNRNFILLFLGIMLAVIEAIDDTDIKQLKEKNNIKLQGENYERR